MLSMLGKDLFMEMMQKKKTLFKAAKPNGANGGEGFSQPECQILHLKDTRQTP